MDDGVVPLPMMMGNMTNKGKWAIERQPRVVVEGWTIDNEQQQ
jgi:hypothetical protein